MRLRLRISASNASASRLVPSTFERSRFSSSRHRTRQTAPPCRCTRSILTPISSPGELVVQRAGREDPRRRESAAVCDLSNPPIDTPLRPSPTSANRLAEVSIASVTWVASALPPRHRRFRRGSGADPRERPTRPRHAPERPERTLSLPRRGRYRTSVPAGRTTSQVPPCVATFWHLTSPAFSCA